MPDGDLNWHGELPDVVRARESAKNLVELYHYRAWHR